MPSLSQLPNELILMIVRHVLPEDLEAVSVLSRHIHAVSLPVLEQYHEMKKKYTKVSNLVVCNEDGDNGTPAGMPAGLLSKVLNNPSIGHYIKELEVAYWFTHFTPNNDLFISSDILPTPHVPYPNSQITAFRAALPHALMRNTLTGKHHISALIRWMRALEVGDEDALIALLLPQCPNLESLMLGDGDKRADCIKTVLSLAAMENTMGRILPRLKHVELCLVDTDLVDYIRLFMSLPSMTSLSIRNFQNPNLKALLGHSIVRTLQPGISNVREINLHGEHMDHEVLYEILQSCSYLTRLHCEFRISPPPNQAEEPRYQLCLQSVMSALSSGNKHTLQSLTLRIFQTDVGGFSDWSSSGNPQEIEDEAESILTLMKIRANVLVDRLPMTLRHFVLRYGSMNTYQCCREISLKQECGTPSGLPGLGASHVWVTSDDREEDLVNDVNKMLCRTKIARISTREVRG